MLVAWISGIKNKKVQFSVINETFFVYSFGTQRKVDTCSAYEMCKYNLD